MAKAAQPKDTRSLRVPDELWARVEEEAAHDGLKPSEWVRRALADAVKRRAGGADPAADKDFAAALDRLHARYPTGDTSRIVRMSVVAASRLTGTEFDLFKLAEDAEATRRRSASPKQPWPPPAPRKPGTSR